MVYLCSFSQISQGHLWPEHCRANRSCDLIKVLSTQSTKVNLHGLINGGFRKDIDRSNSFLFCCPEPFKKSATSLHQFPSITECRLRVHWSRIESSAVADLVWQIQFFAGYLYSMMRVEECPIIHYILFSLCIRENCISCWWYRFL